MDILRVLPFFFAKSRRVARRNENASWPRREMR
jgi:hypothetical protein